VVEDLPRKNVELTSARRASEQVDIVTQELLKENSVGRDARLCGNLKSLTGHIKSQTYAKHGGQVAFCGLTAHFRCTACNEWLHFLPSTGIAKGYDCFFKWHAEAFFGLGRMESVRIFKTNRRRIARHITARSSKETSGTSIT
jgi:hypothetical protein